MRSSLILLLLPFGIRADGPADNKPEAVRQVPPKGAVIAEKDRGELKAGLDQLGGEIAALRKSLKGPSVELLPDVEIFHRAVRCALEDDEIFVDKGRDDVKTCRGMLKLGLERATQLKDGKPAWTAQTGLVVRGYRSKIDDTVQPYGIVVPAAFTPGMPFKLRCDVWWHGRGELLTEANFIEGRLKSAGEFVPPHAFVIHPYGRYCNANKFAGEVDTFEVLDHAKKHYPIDESRLVARGFSMGGAACWQFATHFPTLWCAAAPGAGFAETPEFLNNFQNETVKPTWYEERLWRLYNSSDYAANIFNLPTVAYSGEIDRQKQAADVMARELAKEDIDLVHIIGPKTAHQYEPAAKLEVSRLIDAHAESGRTSMPYEVKFVTQTLRYNRCAWLRVDGLGKHWQEGRVHGNFDASGFTLETRNLTGLTIDVAGADTYPGALNYPALVLLDEQKFELERRKSDRSIFLQFRRNGDDWALVKPNSAPAGLHKIAGLQGPLDDAFMDRFIMVRPTGTAWNEKAAAWSGSELKRAVEQWRRVYRGDALVKDDASISEDDIARGNLVLWGDPGSNKILARILNKLPLNWSKDALEFHGKSYEAAKHMPILIFPNPLNPKKYVVLNSGFTFRDYDALNNARQVPKLPDYAIVDITTPPTSRTPGNVVSAGFFDEQWKLQANDGR